MELIEQFSKMKLGTPATHMLSQAVDQWPWSRFCQTYGDFLTMTPYSFGDKHPIFGYLVDKLGLHVVLDEFVNSVKYDHQKHMEEFLSQILENTSPTCEYFEEYSCYAIEEFLKTGKCKFPTLMLLSECDPKQEILEHELFDYQVRGRLFDYFAPADLKKHMKKEWKAILPVPPENLKLNGPVNDRDRLSALKYYSKYICEWT